MKKNYIFLSLVFILAVFKSHSQTILNFSERLSPIFGPESLRKSKNLNSNESPRNYYAEVETPVEGVL